MLICSCIDYLLKNVTLKKMSNEIVYNNSFHLPQFTLCHDLKRKCNSDFRLSEISSGKKIIS